MKFSEGDGVLVKLPGTGLEVRATVKSKKKTGYYLVQYETGETQEYNERNLKPQSKSDRASPPLSPSRIRGRASPSRVASPPRQTSPARRRSPARTKSPARTRSPARRTKTSPSPTQPKPSTRRTSPSRILKLAVEKFDEPVIISEPALNISFPRRRKPIEHDVLRSSSSTSSVFDDRNGSGDIIRITSPILIPEADINSSKILHLKPDYESNVVEPIDDIKFVKFDTLLNKKEFGGWPGALISILTFPLMILTLNLMCNENSCDWSHIPDVSQLWKLDTYFDMEVLLLITAYIALMTVLSLIPFVGKKVSGTPMSREGKREYRMNGLFSFVVILGIIALLEVYDISVMQIMRDKFLQLCVASLIFGMVLSVAMYVQARYLPVSELNTHAVTGNIIYDFYMGKVTSPRVLGFDIKLITLRASLTAVVLFNIAFVMKGIQHNVESMSTEMHKVSWLDVNEYWNMELSMLVTSALFIGLYSFDHLVFESQILTTFEFMYEGFGYILCMGYFTFPFMTTTITRYALEHGIRWNLWQLVAVWLLYLPALFLYRAANSQKHAFRTNPYNPSIAHLESIPTSQGKKLLISGYWGFVRHPNYAADLIMHGCLFSLTPCVPPCLTVLCSIFFILYRIRRDGIRCQTKYGPAWERYCHCVRYNLIPKVF